MPKGEYVRQESTKKYLGDDSTGNTAEGYAIVATAELNSLPGGIFTRQRREAHALLIDKEQKIFDGRETELMGKFAQLREIWSILTTEWDDSGIMRPLWQVDHTTLQDWLGHMEARNVRFASPTTFDGKVEQIKKTFELCGDITQALEVAAEIPGVVEALESGKAVKFTKEGSGLKAKFTAEITELGHKVLAGRTPSEYVAGLLDQTPERARQEVYEDIGRTSISCENIWSAAGPAAVPFMADLDACPIYCASMRMHHGKEVDDARVVAIVFPKGTPQEDIDLTLRKLRQSWRSQ